MNSIWKTLTLVGMPVVLLSCTCATPLAVTEIQKTDKKLTCKDIVLEINEAEHYKDLAQKEQGISMGNALMPVCWVTSYVDVGKAVNAANERIAYLGNIYDVLDCGGRSDRGDRGDKADSSIPPVPVAPPVIQVQPLQPPKMQQSSMRPQSILPDDVDSKNSDNTDFDDNVAKDNISETKSRYGKVYEGSSSGSSAPSTSSGPRRRPKDQF